jgi:hypothetical protein
MELDLLSIICPIAELKNYLRGDVKRLGVLALTGWL